MIEAEDIREFMNNFFEGINFVPPEDPGEVYANHIREQYQMAFDQGQIKVMPTVTGHFDEATGELTVDVNFPSQEVRYAAIKFSL